MFGELNSVYNSDVWGMQKVKIQMTNTFPDTWEICLKLDMGLTSQPRPPPMSSYCLGVRDFMVPAQLMAQT